jgi:hypothetical protein
MPLLFVAFVQFWRRRHSGRQPSMAARRRSRSPARSRPELALFVPPVPAPAAEDVPAAASAASEAVLTAFVRLWAVQQALILLFTQLARRSDQVQACLVGLAFFFPSPLISAAALASRICANVSIVPFVWESHLWYTRAPSRRRIALARLSADACQPPRSCPHAAQKFSLIGTAPGFCSCQPRAIFSSAGTYFLIHDNPRRASESVAIPERRAGIAAPSFVPRLSLIWVIPHVDPHATDSRHCLVIS